MIPATAVRQVPCVTHGSPSGLPCDVTGDCIQRWTAAYRAGQISRADMTAAFQAVNVITRNAIVPAGAI